jgi:inner membrane protein
MDLITHFLVPYFILWLFKSKNKLAGAFGGISLDFDVLIVWISIFFPQYFIFTHRGITHSFIFALVTSTIFIFVISRRWVKNIVSTLINRDLNIQFSLTVILVAYFGAVIHLILDFLTTQGIPLFYPLSIHRYAAEIYYYLDFITFFIASAVLIILYLKLDLKYKKIALSCFIIILVTFGAIRSIEKFEITEDMSNNLKGNYTQLSIYPTSNLFFWNLVKTDNRNKKYFTYEFNFLENRKSNIKTFDFVYVKKEFYKSAESAINQTNNLPIVEKFRWNSFYTCIEATYYSDIWKINYFDFLGNREPNNLTIFKRESQ